MKMYVANAFLIFTNLLFHTQYNLQHVEISDWLSVFHIYCLTISIILLLDCLVQCDFILFSFTLTATTQIYLLKQIAELSYSTLVQYEKNSALQRGYLKCGIQGSNKKFPKLFHKFPYFQQFNVRYKFVHLELFDVKFLFSKNISFASRRY